MIEKTDVKLDTFEVKTSTPWGQADMVTRYLVGLNFYSTPGHGGFKLSKKLNARIPEVIQRETFAGLGLKGWYEEDEDANVVIAVFPGLFAKEHVGNAWAYLKSHRPTWYAALIAVGHNAFWAEAYSAFDAACDDSD